MTVSSHVLTGNVSAEEMTLRRDFSAAIAKGVKAGLRTDAIVVTVMELAKVSAEGSIVACNPEHREELARHFNKVFKELGDYIVNYKVPDDEELTDILEAGAVARGQNLDRGKKSGWGEIH